MIKTILLFYLPAALLFLGLSGPQAPDRGEIIGVTLCELQTHPEQYAGKMVKVRATISSYQREPTLDRPFEREPCVAHLTVMLELPENVRPKPGYELERNDAFRQYTNALKQPVRIQATLEGRFDPVFKWQNRNRVRIGEGEGFGKTKAGDARLVLHRMSDLETMPLPPRL